MVELTTFPNRVWFETENGWAGWQVTKIDRIRRAEFIAAANFRSFQRKLAESEKVPDTKLRRGT